MSGCPLIFALDDDQPPEMQELMLRLKPDGFALRFWSGNRAELLETISSADYVLLERARLTGDLIAVARNLKLIQKCGRGVEGIDVGVAHRLGIPVCCTSSANSIGTAEVTVLLMLAALRRLCEAHDALRSGRWMKFELRFTSHELYEKTVGIVGMGNVGRTVARMLSHGFACNVIYYSRRRLPPDLEGELRVAYRPLDTLLADADIVSLHAPLTAETRHLIGARELSLMKRSAVLINTARGPLVDEQALVKALREGTISAAGLDVFEEEPPHPGNPLLKLNNVVLTPHCGGGSIETITRVFRRAFSNIEKMERGEALPEEDIVKQH